MNANSKNSDALINGLVTGALVRIEYRDDGGVHTYVGRFEGESKVSEPRVTQTEQLVHKEVKVVQQFRLHHSNEIKVLDVESILKVTPESEG